MQLDTMISIYRSAHTAYTLPTFVTNLLKTINELYQGLLFVAPNFT